VDRVDAAVEVRRMTAADITAVVRIETEAFTSPWRADTFANLIGQMGVELLVLTHPDEGVIGYAVLWCVLDQGELANIALASEHRGKGLGAILLASAMEVAHARGVRELYLEVRASNARAIALYTRFGFERVGRRRAYYDAPKEDALVMSKAIE
jgi:ribosomal-protein-alanine N-acetyltransferase